MATSSPAQHNSINTQMSEQADSSTPRQPNDLVAPRGGRGGSKGGRGGRGRGRGERGGSRGSGEPRRGGRGRGRGGASIPLTNDGNIPQSQNSIFGSADGTQLTIRDPTAEETTPKTGSDEDEVPDNSNECFICANTIVYSSIAPCKHTTCHICSLRMRALYKNKLCPHCRTEADYVIFTEADEKEFQDFMDADLVCEDSNLGIRFTSKKIYEDVRLLLQYNCPESKCEVACLSWPDLKRHVTSAHSRSLCELCTKHKHVFAHEHQLFTTKELKKHEKHGDDEPGAINQSGFKGHPECGFCRERFYTGDELYAHCREKHEKCFLCERRNPRGQAQYYVDYNSLAEHFKADHFMCADEECLEKKFVVFDSEIDLKAHMLESHPGGLTGNALKNARRVDMTNFDFAGPSGRGERGRGRGRGGRGGRGGHGGRGGRQENEDDRPSETPLHMSRDELAFQRTLAVQGAQAGSSRTFGGQLTDSSVFAARPTASAANVRPVTIAVPSQPPPPVNVIQENQFPPLAPLRGERGAASSSSGAQTGPAGPMTEEERKKKHANVINRAGNFVKNDGTKLGTFKALVSQYRQGSIPSRTLIDRLWHLFGGNSGGIKIIDLGAFLKDLSEIYEDENKKNALWKGWQDWKALHGDFPPMGLGAPTPTPTQTSRVLRVKSSTAPSRGPWHVGSTDETIPGPASQRRPAPSPAPAPASRTVKPVTMAIRAGGTGNSSRPSAPASTVSKNEFPALPPKKPMHTFGPVKNGRGTAVVNAWSSNGGTSPNNGEAEGTDEDGSSSKKKGKGKAKQTLMHFG